MWTAAEEPGPVEDTPHHSRLAYSSATAPDTPPDATVTGPHRALVRRDDGLASALVGLLGWTAPGADGRGDVVRARGPNAYGHHSATPVLLARHPGGTLLLATLLVLSADPSGCADIHALRSGTGVRTAEDGTVEIRFPDGTTERVHPRELTPPGSVLP
ncbi:T-complex 10 C-terminal domain-containing protein [Streptomyces sp. CRN 30]|uniref:T-complex 10 C-terminal domain-containing protein n=1 Tax=Streptomyces sp. CRN 30 TaxID=3075613 RepID=UPI0039C15C13